jgi:hypothetical protein
MRRRSIALAALLVSALPPALAAAELPRVHALTGGRIVVRPGTAR